MEGLGTTEDATMGVAEYFFLVILSQVERSPGVTVSVHSVVNFIKSLTAVTYGHKT